MKVSELVVTPSVFKVIDPPIVENTMDGFGKLLSYYKSELITYSRTTALQTRLNNALRAKWMSDSSKGEFATLLEAAEAYPELVEKYVSKLKAINERIEELKKEVGVRLTEVADSLEVKPSGTMWTKAGSVWLSSYSTQGYGAGTYAYGEARQRFADKASDNGFEFKIVEQTKKESRWGLSSGHVVVWVNCTPEVWDVLEWKSGVSMKESIRRCWARGVNPRVYWWWLPQGLEKKLGLDYFGNDLKPDSDSESF